MKPQCDLQLAVEISNDFSRLVPLGTLVFYDVPTSEYAFQGIKLGRSEWAAFDADFLYDVYGNRLHPSLQALVFLVRHRFFSATYAVSYKNHRSNPMHGTFVLWKVRVYAVPLDIDGARYVRQWRRTWSNNYSSIQKRAKSHWQNLLVYLDFSSRGWAKGLGSCTIGSETPNGSQNTVLTIIPFFCSEKNTAISTGPRGLPKSLPKSLPQNVYHHMRRWAMCDSFGGEVYGQQPMESVVRDIYSHIITPDLSSYGKRPIPSGLGVPSAEETISKLLQNSAKGDFSIDGVSSSLYPFQLRSVCKMYEKESGSTKACVPHFVQFTSPTGSKYYYDTLEHGFYMYPELYSVPKGGILAENMGLGKTLICLALVCLTKHEISTIPHDLLLQEAPAEAHQNSATSNDQIPQMNISKTFKCPISHENAAYANLPPASPETVISYDLIVISSSLFSKISADPLNVFMRVYWKRLIIDEGHSMSSRSSNLSLSCRSMHSERRWVVTGTPTSGLTNLHMDEDTASTIPESPQKKRRKYIVKGKFNVRDDLGKLGNLVANYFKIEPFHSQPGLWGSSIIKNLTNSNQLTAKLSLQNLIDELMVRHSQAQVEADLVLPQLHHEAVFLEPSYQNKLAINLFTSVLAVNAVSSERVGVDYMFDSSNRQQLQRLVSNLQLSTFYWTGFRISDVKSLMEIAKNCMEKKGVNGELYYGADDLELLRKSVAAVDRALRNPRWRAAASLHEMQIYVCGLPRPYIANFATGELKEKGRRNAEIGVYGAPQLNAVQKFFYKNRFLPVGDDYTLRSRLEESSREFWKDYWLRSERKEKGKFSKPETSSQFDPHAVKEEGLNPSGHSVTHVDEINDFRKNKVHGYLKLASESGNAEKGCDSKEAQILGTASAKLSYLASKLVEHQKEGTKSIVFFEHEDSAYYLTELLDVLGVSYILYATFIGAERRPNNLHDYASHDSESEGGIALIMDLRLASHGLTVVSATRVYFLNPVWQRSIEAQAIKRAHRIGQTKEVFVETLVLRGTLEEEIYRRRLSEEKTSDSQTSNESDLQKKYVIDDTGMQNFVLRHKFLAIDDPQHEYADFSVFSNSDDGHADDHTPSEPIQQDFSLASHSSEITTLFGRTKRCWTMRLFSNGNLQKFNKSKQGKPDLAQLNVEFVEGKEQASSIHKKASTRKRVRF
ncbi:hypothetical protein JCM33374_g5993 [Metschnikowia sp. JCM 33374]|nr:hypothetical protein JCM33374_g5993 [Metschnikowia sp. JCM 33374]